MKAEEIIFWLVAVLVIAVAAWTLFGSPGIGDVAFMVSLAVLGQTMILWREFYSFKGKAEADMGHIKNRLDSIEIKINKILEK